MEQKVITTSCAHCNREGLRDAFFWMSHADFCVICIRQFEREGLARKIPDNPRSFELTEQGVRAMPSLEAVAFCPKDGMPIYRRWVDAGIARAGDDPACPYCLGKEGEMGKHRI